MIDTKRDFDTWLSTFRESIANYSYYTDFNTVYKKIDMYKDSLLQLNVLIGSPNIENDFRKLLKEHPEVLHCIPLLLAKRENEIFCSDAEGAYTYRFDKMSLAIDRYCYFMKETGLFDLLANGHIHNVLDYAIGVGTGLDSNGRKNRGGHLMEDLVENFIKKAGFVKNKTYFKEMYLSDLEKMTGLDLSSLSNQGSSAKRFDYVLITPNCIYACECNFYASSGSKLNETARSYKTLALESKSIPGFKFVWFTDGIGWKTAKNNLKETWDVLDTIFNIKELEDGILSTL